MGYYKGEKAVFIGISPELTKKLFSGEFPKMGIMKGIDLLKYKEDYTFSRFICKLAIECLVWGLIENDLYNDVESLVCNELYKDIIRHARLGNKEGKPWPIDAELIYSYVPFEENDDYKIKCYFDKDNYNDD